MDGKKPLISVIVPVYNGESYLENCIESIFEQSYSPLELLIVNDGSTDHTADVCRNIVSKWQEHYLDGSRTVQVITLGDEGVSVARNTALKQAKGQYICFVDADDRILPQTIDVLYENLIQTGSQVSGCRFFFWTKEEEWKEKLQQSKVQGTMRRDDSTTLYQASEFREQIIYHKNSRCWSKLYDAKVLKENHILFTQGLSIGEDMLFLVDLACLDIQFCETDFEGYAYYQNAQGAMNRKFSRKAMDQITCWEKARETMGGSPKLDSIILISVLLAMERIAILPAEEIKRYSEEVVYGHEHLKQYWSMKALGQLDLGHKVKAVLFRIAPKLYVNLYHLWKRS